MFDMKCLTKEKAQEMKQICQIMGQQSQIMQCLVSMYVKIMEKKLKEARSTIEELEHEIRLLKQDGSRPSNTSSDNDNVRRKKRSRAPKCYFCRVRGHIARYCPNADTSNGAQRYDELDDF